MVILYSYNRTKFGPGPSRGGKGGKVFPGPAAFGGPAAPPSLKNTENGVPGGFFLT